MLRAIIKLQICILQHIVNGEKTKVRYTNYDEENGPGHGYVSYSEQNTVR